MSRRIRYTFLLSVLIILILVLRLERTAFMEIPVHILEKWEHLPPQSDALFILLGDTGPRALYASRLYKEKYAPLIAMGTIEKKSIAAFGLMPDETTVACTVLMRSGIPSECIHVIPVSVSSTFEEAVAARNWAEESGIASLIFVTSSYHSTRANWILKRVFDSSNIHIAVAAVPVPDVDWNPWWTTENGMVTIFNEVAKYFYYRMTFRDHYE